MKIVITKPAQFTPREIEITMSTTCWELISQKCKLERSLTKTTDMLNEFAKRPSRVVESTYGYIEHGETVMGFLFYCSSRENTITTFLEVFCKFLSDKCEFTWTLEEKMDAFEITID